MSSTHEDDGEVTFHSESAPQSAEVSRSPSPAPNVSATTATTEALSPKNPAHITFAITPPSPAPSSSSDSISSSSSSVSSGSSSSSPSLSSSFSSSLIISSSPVPNTSVEYSLGSQADSATSKEALASLPFTSSSSEISDSALTILRRSKVPLPKGFSQRDWLFRHQNLSTVHPIVRSKGYKKYTESEIKEHKTESDGWMVYRGKVYDLTEYFVYHPGGKKQLMRGIGRDATQLFDRIHPWINVESMLSKYCVGTYEGGHITLGGNSSQNSKKTKKAKQDEDDDDEQDEKRNTLLKP